MASYSPYGHKDVSSSSIDYLLYYVAHSITSGFIFAGNRSHNGVLMMREQQYPIIVYKVPYNNISVNRFL